RECVIDGYNGYLVPVKDADNLACKMEFLINNAPTRKKMGRNARLLAEKEFDIEKVIEKHFSIYRRIAKK
ncbi:MAG: glycosyltransferase, partial [Bacteroidales bacterium]|nr:glycosyltransferase [Bacteroidales bacterium]